MVTPKSIGILLFPGFQALDAFGPLDALNLLSREHELTLSLIAMSLEPVTTAFSSPEYPSMSPQFSQRVCPTHTFANAPANLEVLIVPGGLGTRDDSSTESLVRFIKSRLELQPLRYLLSVCTGSLLVGRTGRFAGCSATTNKSAFKQVKDRCPEIRWVESARWVEGETWWSSSGISAGTDSKHPVIFILATAPEMLGKDRGVWSSCRFPPGLE